MPKTYMLKTISENRTSYGGFKWPESGRVECLDWDPTPECGGGLHGALMGQGDGVLFNWNDDAIWLVLEIDSETIVDLDGKIKVPYCDIVYSGDRLGATNKILELGGTSVIGAIVTGGNRSIVTGGYGSTVIGGDNSIVTGGYRSIVIGGYRSTVTGGNRSIVTGGYRSIVTGGDDSTVTGGNISTVIGGDNSTVTGGNLSTVTGGYGSTLIVHYYDRVKKRKRVAIAYVGENGIEPNVAYHVTDGEFVMAE